MVERRNIDEQKTKQTAAVNRTARDVLTFPSLIFFEHRALRGAFLSFFLHAKDRREKKESIVGVRYELNELDKMRRESDTSH